MEPHGYKSEADLLREENADLKLQLAEKDAEIERLRQEAAERPSAADHGEVCEQLAASQAREQQLREALKSVRSIIVEGANAGFNCHAGDWANRLFSSQPITFDAIAHPTDTSALQDLIAKAGEVMRVRCVEYLLSDRKALNENKAVWAANPMLAPDDGFVLNWEESAASSEAHAEVVRALPGVTLEDLK